MKNTKKEIKITRAGYVYLNGKKISERKVNPFYYAEDILNAENVCIVKKWVGKNYIMYLSQNHW